MQTFRCKTCGVGFHQTLVCPLPQAGLAIFASFPPPNSPFGQFLGIPKEPCFERYFRLQRGGGVVVLPRGEVLGRIRPCEFHYIYVTLECLGSCSHDLKLVDRSFVFHVHSNPSLFTPANKVRVARPQYKEDRMVPRGRREAPALGETYANPVEDHRAHHWKNSRPVLGAL